MLRGGCVPDGRVLAICLGAVVWWLIWIDIILENVQVAELAARVPPVDNLFNQRMIAVACKKYAEWHITAVLHA